MKVVKTSRSINAADRNDILKRRDEWQKDYEERKGRYDSQNQAFYKARKAVSDEVENAVAGKLGSLISTLNMTVTADLRYSDTIHVSIGSNEKNVFDESKALSWTYNVELNNGEAIKETSSWSGLQATTEENLRSLQDTVKALTILNNIDWSNLLNRECPSYEDYITEENPDWGEKPNFDEELMMADLEDAVGTDIAFKASEGKAFNSDVYLKINKVSGKRYYMTEYPARSVEKGDYSYHYEVTMNQDKLFKALYRPLKSIEIPE